MTAGDIEKVKPNKDAAETLKRGTGTGDDIDYLFAALASAAGFQAKIALLPDRGAVFFSSSR